ncbi:MAG: glucose-6-phosphate dehydrogenase assembly protein OpcA [Thermomicrobiales bacterium]
MSTSTPMAPESSHRPVYMAEWTTDSIDTGAIYDEVAKLWEQVGGMQDRPRGFDEIDPDVAGYGGGLMRATTLNLVAVAPSEKDAGLIASSVGHLRDFLPSRTVILILRTSDDGAEETIPYTVRVELRDQAQGDEKKDASLKFETITISADAREAGRLASVVSPLLMSELPNYLWWPSGDFARSPLFHDLLAIVDRLIVDSAQLGRDVRGVAALRDLVDADFHHAIIGDFTWLRLGTWRQLIAQFFDGDDSQDCLQTIDSVTVAYADTRTDGSSGLASALLIVGWLGSRLGWEAIDPLDQRAGASWVPLLARNGDRQRTLQVRLIPDKSAMAKFSLRSVELVATGEHPGVFKVERTDEDDMITSSELPTMPLVSRMVYSKRPDNESMLAEELQRLVPDRVFEEALRFATHLLP